MSWMKEFKDFAMRGNVIDLAVAVIVGGAFQKIVSSLVADVIMPIVGLIVGKINFSHLYFTLDGSQYPTMADAEKAGAPILKYGSFLQFTIDFIIVAFIIFMVIKLINSSKKKEEAQKPAAPAAPPEDILLLREIRDSLKSK